MVVELEFLEHKNELFSEESVYLISEGRNRFDVHVA